MKPALFAMVAVVLYAIQNVVLEQKLAKFSVAGILVLYYLVMLPLALGRWGMLRMSSDTAAFPTGTMLALTLVVGVTYFFADYCYVAAYTHGGSLMLVTTVGIMLPIFASLVKFAWTRELPNGYQLAGYALAVVAILLVGKGNQ